MRVSNLNQPFLKRASTLLAALGLNACTSAKDSDPACDSGVVVDGECLPSGCGPISGATVSADPDDDDLQALIDAAAPGDVIELTPGTYPGGIEVTTGPLTLRGWCPELVTIGTDEYYQPTLSVSGSEDVKITGLTVEGGAPGIYLVGNEGQTITMEQIVIQNAGSYGLDASGAFSLVATDLTVLDTLLEGDTHRFGRGVNLVGGVAAEITNAVLDGNHEAAILVSNSTLHLTAAEILNTSVRGDDTFGRGIQLQQGAAATLSGLLVDGNNDAGICVLDSSMDLIDSIISNTSLTAISDSVTESEAGEGVAIYLGEDGDATARTITLSGLTIEGNARAGLLVDGLEVEVDGVTLSGNGYGAVAQSGGVITGTPEDSDPAASEVLEIYDAPMD